MNYIKMDITDEEYKLAKQYADKEMKKAVGKALFQYNTSRDHIIGHLGQIKFDQWLNDNEVSHKYINNLMGYGDDGKDFIINNYIIDVKTAFSVRKIEDINDNYRMFIAEQQLKDHPNVDYFFNIQVEPGMETLGLMGGIEYNNVKFFEVKKYNNNVNPAYNIPLVCLTPPVPWLDELI